MSEADRTKLMKGKGDNLGLSAGVRPGHRKRARRRASRRGDFFNPFKDRHKHGGECLELIVYKPNPFHRVIRESDHLYPGTFKVWQPDPKVPPFSGLDRTVTPVRLNENKDKSPSLFRRLVNRIRSWTLCRT